MKNKLDYGFDAPNIMRNFLIFGITGIFASIFAVSNFENSILKVVSIIILIVSIVVMILGISMYFYGISGKFKMRDFMIDKIKWTGNETVLDVGTGRGLFLVGAAKKLSTGKSIGIDIWNQQDLSGNNIDNAYRNAEIENVRDKVEIKNEDAQQMSFSDNTFDIIYSMFCIHNIEDKAGQEKACFEIARVLKPKGKVLIGDYIPTHDYAKYFEKAGLKIVSSKNYISKVKAMMWMVEAEKV